MYLSIAFLLIASVSNAQIKYRSDGKLTIGNTEPEQFYGITTYGGGMYFKSKTSNFFQIDVTPAATRLASHYDQVVFYNTRLSRFNSIQVQNVYNYSDARAKTDIAKLNYGLSTVDKLNAVTYSLKIQTLLLQVCLKQGKWKRNWIISARGRTSFA